MLQYYILACIITIVLANVPPRPRGVPLHQSSLYYPDSGTEKWTCLDGTKKIRYVQINDDYCDCHDGSDEPGTSACDKATYYCENVGFRSLTIPSSRVNDGICDCCDGSDEYLAGNCANTCQELGMAEMEHIKNRAELHKRGSTMRAEMISKGRQLRVEREALRAELEQRRLEQNAIKEEKQNLQRLAEAAETEALEAYKVLENEREAEEAARLKAEEGPQIQRVEAEAQFLRYDANRDGLVEVAELQVDMSLDRDRSGVVTVEEAKYFLDDRDRIDLDTFIALSWPRIKPLKMLAEGLFKPPKVIEEVEEELSEEHSDDEIQTASVEGSENSPIENDNEEEADLTEDVDTEDHEDFEDEPDVGVGSATPEDKPSIEYDPETQRLVDLANEARQATSDVENEIRQTDQGIKEIDEINNKDYGPNEEYAVMEGECFTFEDREYVYTLCLFDRVSQRSRSGGSETTLGRWEQWVAEGEKKYFKQKYAHGSSCWNGPQRSAIVSLSCGLENRIIAVSEPNRCEYYYEFETPAACAENINGQENTHDEL